MNLRLRDHKYLKTLRWLTFAWSLLLVGGQTLSFEHVHLDNTSESNCVVCTHTDTTPLVAHTDATLHAAHNKTVIRADIQPPLLSAKAKHYHARAPPKT